MRRTITNGISFCCLLFLLHACQTKSEVQAAVAVDKEQVKKEIQAKETEFAELYNKRELRNIGYFADDAVSFLQNRPPLVGKEAILAFLKEDMATNTERIFFRTNEVFISSDGNQVVEIGAFTVLDSLEKPVNTGNYMTLFEKRGGKYVAVRDMSASNRPLPEN